MFLNKKEQTLFCLLYLFDFIVVFSVMSTIVRVIMKPPIKNILSISSPPNAKEPQSTEKIVVLDFLFCFVNVGIFINFISTIY